MHVVEQNYTQISEAVVATNARARDASHSDLQTNTALTPDSLFNSSLSVQM